jgi:hypothetical protein
MVSTVTAWILMYALNSGGVVVYSVYTNEAQCRAVAHTLQYNVSTGIVECVGIELPQPGSAQ